MKLDPTMSAAENALVILPKMARKYFQSGRAAVMDRKPPDELHVFRLKTKRFRYTLEIFRPVYGAQLDGYLSSLRGLQGALGKVSDYQAIHRILDGDRQIQSGLQRELKKRMKDLRDQWRAFDQEGELKRWRTFLSTGPAKTIRKRLPSAVKKALLKTSA